MKYFKISYKSKQQMETKYIDSRDLKTFKYNHKSKYLEFEINANMEAGFLKTALNLSSFETFLTSTTSGIFSIEIFETEDETVS